MDYISVDAVGEVVTVPERKNRDYTFGLENRRGKSVLEFTVIVRDDERPIDINRGDRVLITKAGLFERQGMKWLAVVEGSGIEVIRKRCNEGVQMV